MKLTKALGTKTTIERNLEEARRLLGEIDYLSFKPATEYKVVNGFVALITKPFLYPDVVLIKSRGSFLEARIDRAVFQKPLINYLRKHIWVPLCIGDPLPHYSRDAHHLHIHPEEREEYATLYARL